MGLKPSLREERPRDKVFPMQAVQTEKDNKNREEAGSFENNTVYEIGYHVLSTVAESDVETVIGRLRKMIEKAGGSFVAEGAPQKMALAYPMAVWSNGKWTKYSDSYFGWLKFEVSSENIADIDRTCKADKDILRYLILTTVREDTRASVRQFVLKEVRRTDTIKTTARAKPTSEVKEEVSDEKLDEAIEEMVAD